MSVSTPWQHSERAANIASLILVFVTRWSGVVNVTPQPLYPRERNIVHVEVEAAGVKEPVSTFWRNLSRYRVNFVFSNACLITNAQACSEIHAVSLLTLRVPIFLKLLECGDWRMSKLVGP